MLNRDSLRFRLLMPIAVIGVLIAIVTVSLLQLSATRTLRDSLQNRALSIATALQTQAENVDELQEIDDFAHQLGKRQTDILLILLMAGTDDQILGSNLRGAHGSPISDIPELRDVRSDLVRIKKSGTGFFESEARQDIELLIPVTLTGKLFVQEHWRHGFVLVRFNPGPVRHVILQQTLILSGAIMTALAALMLFMYRQLQQLIFCPVERLTHSMQRQEDAMPYGRHDELAIMTASYSAMRRALLQREADQKREAALLRQTQLSAGVGGWELNASQEQLYWTEQTYAIHGQSGEPPPPWKPGGNSTEMKKVQD